MSAYGIPQEDIATVLDIGAKTLRKHYRTELDTGTAKANAKVAENLYKHATGEGRAAVTAAIFWMKTRAGWRETIVNEHKNLDSIVSDSPVTDEQWKQGYTNGKDPNGSKSVPERGS